MGQQHWRGGLHHPPPRRARCRRVAPGRGALSDGKRLAVSGVPLKELKKPILPIFLLDVEHGTLIKTISASLSDIHCLDFSPDGKRLAAGYFDGSVQVFDVNTGRSVGKVSAHFGPLREVRFHPTSKNPILGTLRADDTANIWDINSKRKSTLDLSNLSPTTICWSHDGSMLGVGGQSGEIMLFRGNGQLIRKLPKRTYKERTVEIIRMKFLPNDREIAFCSVSLAGVISAFDGKSRVEFTGHDNTVMAINVSADGKPRRQQRGEQSRDVCLVGRRWQNDCSPLRRRQGGLGRGLVEEGEIAGLGNG